MSDGALGLARGFRDLIVYQRARDTAKAIYSLSLKFPSEERYSLTDQIRRSSRSIGAQIAEAWAKRRYPKHFASKLSDADGEQLETQHWLEAAVDCEIADRSVVAPLLSTLDEIGRMLNSMIRKADTFSPNETGLLREDSAEYLNTTHY